MKRKTNFAAVLSLITALVVIFLTATCGDRDVSKQQAQFPVNRPLNPCAAQDLAGESGNACSAHEVPAGIPSREVLLKPVPESAYAGLAPFVSSESAATEAQLQAWDFSPFLDALPDGLEAKGRFADIWDHERATISTSLSNRERRALYGLHVPFQGVILLPTMEIHAFFAECGRLPADAMELARFMGKDRFTPEWFSKLATQPAMDQYRAVSQYVNPVTGRLYDSFECTEWQAGGVLFTPLPANPSSGDPHFEVMSNLRTNSKPLPEAWLLRLYGDEPGETLLETALYFYTCAEFDQTQAR